MLRADFAMLQEIRCKIAVTDERIDEIVYGLYGITKRRGRLLK